MNRDDILVLARAGFTAAQIAALSAIQPAQQPARQPAEQPARQPAEQPAEQPAQQPMQQPAAQPIAGVDAILAQLGVLTQAVQANGIVASTQPKQETTDDILAAIIAPPQPKT